MNEKKLKQFIYYNELFAVYGKLLTPRQQEVFSMYYLYNLSQQEISEALKISKAGVSDNLKKAVKHLQNFEKTLGNVAKNNKRRELLEKLAKTASKEQKDIINTLLKEL